MGSNKLPEAAGIKIDVAVTAAVAAELAEISVQFGQSHFVLFGDEVVHLRELVVYRSDRAAGSFRQLTGGQIFRPFFGYQPAPGVKQQPADVVFCILRHIFF